MERVGLKISAHFASHEAAQDKSRMDQNGGGTGMTREFYRENKGFFNAIDGLLLKNTVLEKGLVVAPVVVVSNSLKNAVALSLVFGLITFFTVLAVSFVPKRIPHTIRVIISVLLAAVLYIPIAMLVDLWFPGSSYQIGVFVPLMITNSLVVWRSESRFHKEGRSRMIGDLICHILGFFVVIAVVGAVRELWGAGTLWGNPMSFAQYPVTGILLPFGGFCACGIFWQLCCINIGIIWPVRKVSRKNSVISPAG